MTERRLHMSEDSIRPYSVEEDAEKEDSAFLGAAGVPARKNPTCCDHKQWLYRISIFIISMLALVLSYKLGGRVHAGGGSKEGQNATSLDPQMQEALRDGLASVRTPPDTPDTRQLPDPAMIFRETSQETLRKPLAHDFPDDHYSRLYKTPSQEEEAEPEPDTMPEDAYERRWKSLDWFDANRDSTGSDLPRIQAEASAFEESSSQKSVRLGRKEAVKRAFIHAWQGYKDHAWGEFVAAYSVLFHE